MSFLFPSPADTGQAIGDAILGAGDYGKDIQYVFGCYRMPGVDVWQQAHADAHQGSGGGKGDMFQPAAGSQTTYTGSSATVFALAPDPALGVVGIRKLWQDNKLIYTVAENATAAEITATTQISGQLQFYLGTNTQTRDPTIVGRMGSSVTSAYRGQVYVVANALTWSNGRAPSFTAEVCHTGTLAGGAGSTLTRASTSLAYVFRTLCLSVGIPFANIDLTQVTDDLRGYAISKGKVKDGIDSLCQYYNYGLCQSGYNVEFYKLNRSTVFNIPFGDLDNQDITNGSSTPSEALPIQETAEKDLPITIRVKAKNFDADYAVITGEFTRPTGNSINVIDVDMGDFTATTTELAQAANMQMYKAVVERIKSIKMNIDCGYLALEPGDAGIANTIDSMSITNRLTKVDIGANYALQTEGVQHSANTYASSNAGPIVGGGLQIFDAGATTWYWLNIAPIHDAEAVAPGAYIAITGIQPGWKNGTVYQSKNGVSGTYTGVLSIGSPAALGVVSGTMADGQTFTWDDVTSVIVNLVSGSLASITDDQVLAGGNVAIIGGEIVQFATATLTGSNQYTLTRFLRGRRATEQYSTGHSASENFALLTDGTGALAPGIGFISCNYSDLNRVDYWKVVPNGHVLSSETAQSHLISGQNMIPFSPVDANPNLTIVSTYPDLNFTWIRRSRIGSVMTDGQEIPLGETTERYHVQLLNVSNNPFRDLYVTSPSWAYVHADRNFDFGSYNASMAGCTFRVAQWSSTMGDGAWCTLPLTDANTLTP